MTSRWDTMEEWTVKACTAIVEQAKADFDQGHFGKELSAKLEERGLSQRDVEIALTSGRSLIGKYDHEGQERIGFWYPPTGIFVAWKPTEPTRIVTVFQRGDGEDYLRRLDAEPIRR